MEELLFLLLFLFVLPYLLLITIMINHLKSKLFAKSAFCEHSISYPCTEVPGLPQSLRVQTRVRIESWYTLSAPVLKPDSHSLRKPNSPDLPGPERSQPRHENFSSSSSSPQQQQQKEE